MNKFLRKVTVTGADDQTCLSRLTDLSLEYPFVEWGILLSKQNMGKGRFPSMGFLEKLHQLEEKYPINLSGHICGSWTKQVCQGNWEILNELKHIFSMFSRIQLNFHALVDNLNQEDFFNGFDRDELYFKQFIFQLKDVNNPIIENAKKHEIDAVGLFDTSGGNGLKPENWPESNSFCGYAGGLSPDNLSEELNKIQSVCKQPIWIDVESKVRTQDVFDLDLVEKFLKISKPFARSAVRENQSCYQH